MQAAAPHFTAESSLVERVLALENERLALMPAVAAWKWQHHAAVTDAARERAILADTARLARPLGLDAKSVERLFALQMRLARGVETALLSQWRREGFHFTGPVPDLAEVVRPRLDRLTAELLRALYLAAPAFPRPDFAARYTAAAAQRLNTAAWTPRSRTELLGVLSGIRVEPDSATAAPRSAPALQRIRSAGVLRIGTTGDYAPLSIEHGGRLAGVDIDLARSLAQALRAEPMFVRTSWPALLDDLRRGAFDVAIGGISSTSARAAAAALSIPYLSGGKTIAARCADASRFGSLAAVDRPGVRVIVNPGGTNEQYARAHLHRARILVDRDNTTLFDALAAGRADAVITDDTEVELQVRRHPDLCRALPGTLTHADKVILMVRDPALTRAVNGWLRGEIAAGVPARLLRDALASPPRR
jgi:cyclohexadienyl dehydratase